MSGYSYTSYLPYEIYQPFPNFEHDRLRSHLAQSETDKEAESMIIELDLIDPDEEKHPFAARLIIPKVLLKDDTPSHEPYWPAKDVLPAPNMHELLLISEKGEKDRPSFYRHDEKQFVKLIPISTMGDREDPAPDTYYFQFCD